jgi:hypothetical protein
MNEYEFFIFSHVYTQLSPQSKSNCVFQKEGLVKYDPGNNIISSGDVPRYCINLQTLVLKVKKRSIFTFLRNFRLEYLRSLNT